MGEETARGRVVAALTAPGGGFDVEERTVRGLPMRVYTTLPNTLRGVFEQSKGYGDRDFLVYGDERWTFAEHYRIVAGLARQLMEHHGLRKGDRVAVAMRNYPEWAPIFWATQVAGLVAVPLNAWWSGQELQYALRDSGTRVLFADAERVATVRPYLPDLDLGCVVEVRGADRDGSDPGGKIERWDDFRAAGDRMATAPELPDVAIDPEDDATIVYTSGTTGRPKGAVGSHRNHATNTWNTTLSSVAGAILRNGGSPPPPPGPGDPLPGILQTFPFFHIAGMTMLCAAAAGGAKLACLYRWDPAFAARLIADERLTSAVGVPTVMRSLVEALSEAAIDPDGVASLAQISLGGAPIPPDLVRRIDAQFASKVGSGDGYGLTETTSSVVTNAGDDYVSHPDSVGRCLPGSDIRVVDPGAVAPDVRDVPEGQVGELWFRGPTVVRGYWNDPEATAAAFTDGWFRTGDLGYVRDGWIYVVDRIKDVVIRGGENVYCAEVEAALFEHPAVADVAVVGMAHPSLGEEVAAVVNRRPGHDVTAKELHDHVAARVAAFKAPTRVWFRADPLPRTSTGKVLKRDLRRAAETQPAEVQPTEAQPGSRPAEAKPGARRTERM